MVILLHQVDWATGCPDVWSNVILGVSVRNFWMRLTFESVDWVKQIALPNLGGPHPSVEGLSRTKSLTLPLGGENCFPLAFDLEVKYQLFLGLEPPGPWAGNTIGSPGSPPWGLTCGSWHVFTSVVKWAGSIGRWSLAYDGSTSWFFDFTTVQKLFAFSRNHTSNFEFSSFPSPIIGSVMMPGSSSACRSVSHMITRMNNWYTYNHSAPRQPFCFSLQYSIQYITWDSQHLTIK